MQSNVLIEHLLKASAYTHSTSDIHLVETHCAWILLTGEFAYKIKKPVDFGFLDFTTLRKRRFFCEEEIRLNRRFAPNIYLDVIAITGSPEDPKVGGAGTAIEYAVRMRQFPENGLLSQRADQGQLSESYIDQLADVISVFHENTDRAPPDTPYGDPDHIHHWVNENFAHIRAELNNAELDKLKRIEHWSNAHYKNIFSVLQSRKKNGFIRECHGDLHLGNITLIDDHVTLFDCIEFNAELRWIDVMSEIAFLVMDIDDRGYEPYAFRFLNAYLQQTGDYTGLRVFRYYLVYRAMVRAKVALLRRRQSDPGSDTFEHASSVYRQYIDLAEHYLVPQAVGLFITHGLSGSGKSTLARQLCEQLGMVQLRSDVERKRLAGLRAEADSHSETGTGLYSADQSRLTYERLAELAETVLQSGYHAIVDATFLKKEKREVFGNLAGRLGVPLTILHCQASESTLKARISKREQSSHDASEATLNVLHSQLHTQEPLTEGETAHCLNIDTQQMDFNRILPAIKKRLLDR